MSELPWHSWGGGYLSDGCQQRGVGQEAFFSDPVAEVADFLGREGALISAEFELCVAKKLKDLSEAGEVLFPGGGKDDDVVQVEKAGLPVEAGQDAVHEPGECGRGIAEAKGDLVEFK